MAPYPMRCILGVDIGTTSAKAIAFDLHGRVLASKSVPYPLINPRPDWSEQDPHVVLQAVQDAIKSAVLQSRPHNILAVSFSCAMHSLMAVDARGRALTPLIIWADSRSAGYAERLKAAPIGRQIYRETGTPIHPMSPLCKLLWMKDHQPQVFAKAAKFLSIKGFVFHHFFSEYAVDYGIASATGLFNIFNLQWSRRALKLLGLKPGRLERAVPPTAMFQGMKKNLARRLGIDPEVPWVIGGSDGCLANLGASAVRPGHAALTLGTSGAIRTVSAKPVSDPKGRTFSYILDEKHFVLGGPVSNGGIVFNWFRDHFGDHETYEDLMEKASAIRPGSGGLVCLPYILGERAPHWDAHSRGVYFGVNIKHGRYHFLRASIEGVVFGLYSVGRVLEEQVGTIQDIRATGNVVKSVLWMQMIADIFNKTVRVLPPDVESSCLGAAMLAMKALGQVSNLDELRDMVPVTRSYHPNRTRHRIYQKNFAIFDSLYTRLKGNFAQIAALQE